MARTRLFTSESVSEGHPDKVCDRISDSVLDAILEQDPASRVACESLTTTDLIVVSGEITTKAVIDYEKVARNAVEHIGYNDAALGFSAKSAKFLQFVHTQSPDIAMGVDADGAGDQGMMFGFACNETPELMPLPIALAHQLVKRQSEVRRDPSSPIHWLRPDAKSQVTIAYEENCQPRVHTVVLSTQHSPLVGGDFATADDLKREHDQIYEAVVELIIKPVLGDRYHKDLIIHVNPTGRFVMGGPHGDTGLTGRKIIVDTYGGMGRHGGGAFSGKDPSKVDRSAAYAARWIAKNIVAGGVSDRCEVQISYAIGVAQPTSIDVNVDTFGGSKIPESELIKAVYDTFDLTPKGIIKGLDLRRPIYATTAAYGHFGRNEATFSWEQTPYKDVFAELVRKYA